MTPKFTVNLGLRYDFATWPYEGADRLTNLDPVTGLKFTPANSQFGKSLVKPDKNNFAPRIGLVYQLTPETVVRAGYGRFYMLFERAGSEDQLALNLPYLVNNVATANNNNVTANNIRLQTGFNLSLDPSAVNPTTVRLRAVNPEAVDPSIDQWNIGIQRQLPGNMVATLDYVGTKGTHLSTLKNLNQPLFNPNGTIMNAVINGTLQPVLPRSGLARACHSEEPTPTRNPLMSRRNISLLEARAALHKTHIIGASGAGPATLIYDITSHSVTSMNCPSATAPVILPMARFHTFSVGGVSAVQVVFVVADHLHYVLVTTMQCSAVRGAAASLAPSPIASGMAAFQGMNAP